MKNEIESSEFHNHNEYSKDIINNIPNEKIFEKASETFQLISDASRLKILWLLCHCELCVNNIALIVKMSSPAVSHHLKILKSSGLIDGKRVGKEIYYKLTNSSEADLVHKSLDDILNIKCPK